MLLVGHLSDALLGLVVQFSDERFKFDVQELADAVQIVSKLEGKSYLWRRPDSSDSSGSGPDGARVLGFIAQSVQRIAPELIAEDSQTGLLAVEYSSVVPLLVEVLKAQAATQSRFDDEVVEELNRSSYAIKITLENLKSVREGLDANGPPSKKRRPPPPPPRGSRGASEVLAPATPAPSASQERKQPKKSSRVKGLSWPLCGCISKPLFIILAAGIATLIVAAIVLASVLLTAHRAAPAPISIAIPSAPSTPQATAPPPDNFTWRNQNYIPNGGFETPDPQNPTKVQNITGNYTLYAYGTKKRDIQGQYPLIDNATLYFDAGANAARVYIDPVWAQNTQFWNPATLVASVDVESILRKNTGFSNASSGARGMNVTGWFNWMYCEDVPAVQYPNRTIQQVYVIVNYFIGGVVNNSLTKEVRFNLTTAPNKGWSLLWAYVPFEPAYYPGKLVMNWKSSLRGNMFWDYFKSYLVF